MLSTDLTLDPSVAIVGGTSSPTVYSLLGGTTPQQSIRSVSALRNTYPENFTIGHATRKLKGLKTVANASVPASDVVFDRHLARLDINVPQTSHLDPEYKVNTSVQIVFEVPRVGGSTPTTAAVADALKSIVSTLCASSNANLERVLGGEV